MAMHIDLSIDGGLASLPGLRRPVSVDVGALPPASAERLCALVEKARFFQAPQAQAAGSGADRRTYIVKIDDGERCRTLQLHEPIADAAMRELVGEIRSCIAQARSG